MSEIPRYTYEVTSILRGFEMTLWTGFTRKEAENEFKHYSDDAKGITNLYKTDSSSAQTTLVKSVRG